MHLLIERRWRPAMQPRQELFEILTPPHNRANLAAAENFLAALTLGEPFSLEIAGDPGLRWFLVRTGSESECERLRTQLAAAYPQAGFRGLDLPHHLSLDPAVLGPSEQVSTCVLALRTPEYLPLKMFRESDLDGRSSTQADPLLGVLNALGALPPGWRGLIQVVLRAAPHDWSRPYASLLDETAWNRYPREASAPSVMLGTLPLVAMALALQGYQWYRAGDWPHLVAMLGGPTLGLGMMAWLKHRFGAPPAPDLRLVREKIGSIGYQCQIRVSVFAPASEPAGAVRGAVERVAATYHQFSLATGNGLAPRWVRPKDGGLSHLSWLPGGGRPSVLNVRELAGLWHLPRVIDEAPLLERTASRQRLPLPSTVARGCPIGISAQQGKTVPVSLPDELTRRHLLLVGKTGRGKSSLLLHLARYYMAGELADPRPALVLFDPHQDLAHAAVSLVPPSRRGDVVYLDLAQRNRPFGLNLIDAGLGWDREQAVANSLFVFKHEFDHFWGPRMEDAFRFALLTLFEANQRICAVSPESRSWQHTILDVPAVLMDGAFRRSVMRRVENPVVKTWWSEYWEGLDKRLQVEYSNPVVTKVHRYAGSGTAGDIIGQPRSTVNPFAWVESGQIVIINTAKGVVGEDASALIGAALLNLIALAIGRQAAVAPERRRHVAMLVDEFHSMPGANYEIVLSELAKYGANLVLATQSLARLQHIDHEHSRALRSTVFANLSGLFAFNTSAEDARYLVEELGDDLEVEDLVGLANHQCYVRMGSRDERLPVFSVQLQRPPAGDLSLAEQMATASAVLYGRPAAAVEADINFALKRIQESHKPPPPPVLPGQPGMGVTKDAVVPPADGRSSTKDEKKRRTDNRPTGRTKEEARQAEMAIPEPEPPAPDEPASPGEEVPLEQPEEE